MSARKDTVLLDNPLTFFLEYPLRDIEERKCPIEPYISIPVERGAYCRTKVYEIDKMTPSKSLLEI